MNGSLGSVAPAQRLTLADLPGFLAKRLHVPPDHVGVVVDGKGRVRTLPPGQHRVIRLWRRLLGRVSDWQFYLLPGGSFPLRIPVPRLRAGDGEWVNVQVLVTLHITDPTRAGPLLIDPTRLAMGLSAEIEGPTRGAVAGWAGADLERPDVSERLSDLLHPILEAQLTLRGLALERIVSVSVRPYDETVTIARKKAELEAALAEVEMEQRMDRLSSQAELNEFVRHLEADYGLPGDVLRMAVEPPPH